jgi:putative hydrolase of the HAD superfamily
MKYKAVIFDLFGTLVDNYPWIENNNNLGRMASVLELPADDFVSQWHDAFDDRMTGTFKNYQDCIAYICRQLGKEINDDKIELATNIRLEMTAQEVTTPRDGAVEVLTYLKSKGYKTGLISDCSTETTRVWKDSPFKPFIDKPVFSCLVGIKKPDPLIFNTAVERLGVNPEDCMYVADGIGEELSGARKLGMHAIQILVPDEDDYNPYRGEWDGQVITSLREILEMVE